MRGRDGRDGETTRMPSGSITSGGDTCGHVTWDPAEMRSDASFRLIPPLSYIDMSLSILSLPVELVSKILEYTGYRTIIACRKVSLAPRSPSPALTHRL
jgi:F-box domain